MCDTLIKRQPNGFIFGKNSDRSCNEPNLTLYIPASNPTSKDLHCTYISIEQVQHTYAMLLIKPSWMWGAEMGINEHGVIIGNEAVFTTSKHKNTPRLLGMDLLRLGLERGSNAEEALDTIIHLLEQYGQGGNCGFDKSFTYDNSYLIVDQTKAYILETVGTHWVVKQVEDGSISNRLSIETDYDRSSFQKVIHFRKQFTEPLFTFFSGSKHRRQCTLSSLQQDMSISDMISLLQSHQPQDEKHLYTKGSIKSVCMHQTLLGDHTTSSMIVEAREDINTIWLTSCSTPCLSLYKPTYFGIKTGFVFEHPQDALDYWLEREYLVRAIYAGLIDETHYKHQLSKLQLSFIEKEQQLMMHHPSLIELETFSQWCDTQEKALIAQYREAIEQVKENLMKLPSMWKQKTKVLGQHVFERELHTRLK